MIKKINIIQFIAIIIFIIIISSPLYAINKIFGGNIDGTLPTTASPPGSGASGNLLTSSGTFYSSEGSFLGSRNDAKIYTSSDGIIWNYLSDAHYGVDGWGYLYKTTVGTILYNNNSCIRRSINGGSSWTTVLGVCSINDVVTYNRIIADLSNNTILYAHGSGQVIFKSINDGQTWSLLYTTPEICGGLVDIFANGNTIIAIRQGLGSPNNCDANIYVSTDAGSTWIIFGDDVGEPFFNTRDADESVGIFYFKNIYWIVASSYSANWKIYYSLIPTGWTNTNYHFYTQLPAGQDVVNSLVLENGYNPATLYIGKGSGNRMLYYSIGCSGTCPSGGLILNDLYNPGIADVRGNLLYIPSNNALYFGLRTNRFYEIK